MGRSLAYRVYLGCMSYTVEECVPKPIRCFPYQRFGQTAAVYKGKQRCPRCGEKCIDDLEQKTDIICIQGTWFRPNLDFKICQYTGNRCDRTEGVGGGCATFTNKNLN